MTCFPTLNRKLAVLLARQSLCNGSACSPSPASSHAKSPDAVMKQRSARADSMQTIKRCVRAILYSPKPISLHEDEYRRLLMVHEQFDAGRRVQKCELFAIKNCNESFVHKYPSERKKNIVIYVC